MEEEATKIHLTLTDDTKMECNVLGTFEVEGLEYIVLIPIDEDQVLLYRFEEKENDIELINIEDDEEFERVSKVFYETFVEEEEDISDEE